MYEEGFKKFGLWNIWFDLDLKILRESLSIKVLLMLYGYINYVLKKILEYYWISSTVDTNFFNELYKMIVNFA